MRHASPDVRRTASEGDSSSASSASSRENLQPSSTPPPDRSLRCSKGSSSRNVSPSQSLLDRYETRSAGSPAASTTTNASASRPAKCKVTHSVGKDTAFTENFDVEAAATSSTSMEELIALEKAMDNEKQIFDGVEFEIVGGKGRAGEAPLVRSGEYTAGHAPRRTKSQARRQERADSHDATDDVKDSAKSGSLVPPGLTIRKPDDKKLPRTPSPQTTANNSENFQPSAGAPTPTNSPNGKTAPSRPATLRELAKTSVPLSRLPPSPDPVTGMPTFNLPKKSASASLSTNQSKASPAPVPVFPPIFNGTLPPGYQWVSHLSSTSRPAEPWGWLKTWTCCQCQGERRGAAQTMVEQKVCSRLTCGHVRCVLGCRVLRDRTFDGPGVFAMP